MYATRAAVGEGIVPGGGVALLRCAAALDAVETDNEEQVAGLNILRRATLAPLRFISDNAGVEGSIVVPLLVMKRGQGTQGSQRLQCSHRDLH